MIAAIWLINISKHTSTGLCTLLFWGLEAGVCPKRTFLVNTTQYLVSLSQIYAHPPVLAHLLDNHCVPGIVLKAEVISHKQNVFSISETDSLTGERGVGQIILISCDK